MNGLSDPTEICDPPMIDYKTLSKDELSDSISNYFRQEWNLYFQTGHILDFIFATMRASGLSKRIGLRFFQDLLSSTMQNFLSNDILTTAESTENRPAEVILMILRFSFAFLQLDASPIEENECIWIMLRVTARTLSSANIAICNTSLSCITPQDSRDTCQAALAAAVEDLLAAIVLIPKDKQMDFNGNADDVLHHSHSSAVDATEIVSGSFSKQNKKYPFRKSRRQLLAKQQQRAATPQDSAMQSLSSDTEKNANTKTGNTHEIQSTVHSTENSPVLSVSISDFDEAFVSRVKVVLGTLQICPVSWLRCSTTAMINNISNGLTSDRSALSDRRVLSTTVISLSSVMACGSSVKDDEQTTDAVEVRQNALYGIRPSVLRAAFDKLMEKNYCMGAFRFLKYFNCWMNVSDIDKLIKAMEAEKLWEFACELLSLAMKVVQGTHHLHNYLPQEALNSHDHDRQQKGLSQHDLPQLTLLAEQLLEYCLEDSSTLALRSAVLLAEEYSLFEWKTKIQAYATKVKMQNYIRKGRWMLTLQMAKNPHMQRLLIDLLIKADMFIEADAAYKYFIESGDEFSKQMLGLLPVSKVDISLQQARNAAMYLQFPHAKAQSQHEGRGSSFTLTTNTKASHATTKELKESGGVSIVIVDNADAIIGLAQYMGFEPQLLKQQIIFSSDNQSTPTLPRRSKAGVIAGDSTAADVMSRLTLSEEKLPSKSPAPEHPKSHASPSRSSSTTPKTTPIKSHTDPSKYTLPSPSLSPAVSSASQSSWPSNRNIEWKAVKSIFSSCLVYKEDELQSSSLLHEHSSDIINQNNDEKISSAEVPMLFKQSPFRLVVAMDAEWQVEMYESSHSRGASILQLATIDHVFLLDFNTLMDDVVASLASVQTKDKSKKNDSSEEENRNYSSSAINEDSTTCHLCRNFLWLMFSDPQILKVGWAFNNEDATMIQNVGSGFLRGIFDQAKGFLDLSNVITRHRKELQFLQPSPSSFPLAQSSPLVENNSGGSAVKAGKGKTEENVDASTSCKEKISTGTDDLNASKKEEKEINNTTSPFNTSITNEEIENPSTEQPPHHSNSNPANSDGSPIAREDINNIKAGATQRQNEHIECAHASPIVAGKDKSVMCHDANGPFTDTSSTGNQSHDPRDEREIQSNTEKAIASSDAVSPPLLHQTKPSSIDSATTQESKKSSPFPKKQNKSKVSENQSPPFHVSLSDACERYLGKPLNKNQRLSRWDSRPLSHDQCTYAALDAHCLLGVLDVMLQECRGFESAKEETIPCHSTNKDATDEATSKQQATIVALSNSKQKNNATPEESNKAPVDCSTPIELATIVSASAQSLQSSSSLCRPTSSLLSSDLPHNALHSPVRPPHPPLSVAALLLCDVAKQMYQSHSYQC